MTCSSSRGHQSMGLSQLAKSSVWTTGASPKCLLSRSANTDLPAPPHPSIPTRRVGKSEESFGSPSPGLQNVLLVASELWVQRDSAGAKVQIQSPLLPDRLLAGTTKQRFSAKTLVGATGFEPATFRPPAGRRWARRCVRERPPRPHRPRASALWTHQTYQSAPMWYHRVTRPDRGRFVSRCEA
jgi:hypothetical protein